MARHPARCSRFCQPAGMTGNQVDPPCESKSANKPYQRRDDQARASLLYDTLFDGKSMSEEEKRTEDRHLSCGERVDRQDGEHHHCPAPHANQQVHSPNKTGFRRQPHELHDGSESRRNGFDQAHLDRQLRQHHHRQHDLDERPVDADRLAQDNHAKCRQSLCQSSGHPVPSAFVRSVRQIRVDAFGFGEQKISPRTPMQAILLMFHAIYRD